MRVVPFGGHGKFKVLYDSIISMLFFFLHPGIGKYFDISILWSWRGLITGTIMKCKGVSRPNWSWKLWTNKKLPILSALILIARSMPWFYCRHLSWNMWIVDKSFVYNRLFPISSEISFCWSRIRRRREYTQFPTYIWPYKETLSFPHSYPLLMLFSPRVSLFFQNHTCEVSCNYSCTSLFFKVKILFMHFDFEIRLNIL